MKRLEIILAVMILADVFAFAAEMEERTIQSNREKITISVPKDWPAIGTRHTSAGKAYYQIGPANTNYSIQFYLNEPLQRGTNVEERLQHSLESSLKPLIANSVERKLQFMRFGKDKEGMYARLTDRAPKPGEFLFYTRGVRLIGTNALGFELASNDKDFSALSNTLAVVESVRVAGAETGVK
jgi:hypothetical protein